MPAKEDLARELQTREQALEAALDAWDGYPNKTLHGAPVAPRLREAVMAALAAYEAAQRPPSGSTGLLEVKYADGPMAGEKGEVPSLDKWDAVIAPTGEWCLYRWNRFQCCYQFYGVIVPAPAGVDI